MGKFFLRFLFIVPLLPTFIACGPDAVYSAEKRLSHVIQLRNLRPLPTKPFFESAKYKLGQALFFDPILSGNRDVSCATCHLISRGTSDALPQSIGVAGVGLAERRIPSNKHDSHPTNSLDLWNRDNNTVTSFFWDGRIEPLGRGRFKTPLGEQLPAGLENAMAAQALFPIITPDEMLGYFGETSPSSLPETHAGLENELVPESFSSESDRAKQIYSALMLRLLGTDNEERKPWQNLYKELFTNAHSGDIKHLTIADVGNALSHYEEIAFATRATPWDRYLEGNMEAISEHQKEGALLFFGKARCSVCHNGPLFSDFQFYSVGVNGVDLKSRDKTPHIGRFGVTNDKNEMFKFRTPPLRNATLSAPYFHDGSARTLHEVIVQHLDPLKYADQYLESGRFAMSKEEIEAVSPILLRIVELSEMEVSLLLAFLTSLEDNPKGNFRRLVPLSVPSGLPVATLLE